MTPKQKEVLNKLQQWAARNKDVDCVICTGSQGNQNKVSDDLSDIDVVIFTRRIDFYLEDPAWIHELGTPAYDYVETLDIPGVKGVRKVYFSNGVQIDLLFWKKSMLKLAYRYTVLRERTFLVKLLPKIVCKMIENTYSYFPKYIRRGFMTVVDKENYFERIQYVERKNKYRHQPVSVAKLQYTVSRFWSHALAAAIYIRRNELFAAKVVGDRSMKQLLLHLIEIYTTLSRGRDFDMWQDGRKVEHWAPQFITRRLKNTYGRYEAEDAFRAAMETIDLFSAICDRINEEHPEVKFSNPEQHFRKLIKAVSMGRREAVAEL